MRVGPRTWPPGTIGRVRSPGEATYLQNPAPYPIEPRPVRRSGFFFSGAFPGATSLPVWIGGGDERDVEVLASDQARGATVGSNRMSPHLLGSLDARML